MERESAREGGDHHHRPRHRVASRRRVQRGRLVLLQLRCQGDSQYDTDDRYDDEDEAQLGARLLLVLR